MPTLTLEVPQGIYDSLHTIALARGYGSYVEYLLYVAKEDIKASKGAQAADAARSSAVQAAEEEWNSGSITVT